MVPRADSVRSQDKASRVVALGHNPGERASPSPWSAAWRNSNESYPTWTPDGLRVVFSSTREGPPNLFWRAADGTGAVERLTDSPNEQDAYAFSPDGTRLVFREIRPDTGEDLGVLSMEGDRSTAPLVVTEFVERNAELSPDGRWIAYESNASGSFEVYVRPFPAVDEGQWLVSTNGGQRPLWSPDGRELFYLSGPVNLNRPALMAVPILIYALNIVIVISL